MNRIVEKSNPGKLTDEQWQEQFKLIKSRIKRNSLKWMSNENLSNDDTYSTFINGILTTIRGTVYTEPDVDYCFYTPQIIELLKYEPNLKTFWDNKAQCFEVWL